VDRIEEALRRSAEVLARSARRALQSRLAELTERERDVMRLVAKGLPNKLIADQLAISVRTVEVHRARVFDKMEVKSAVELANLLRDGLARAAVGGSSRGRLAALAPENIVHQTMHTSSNSAPALPAESAACSGS
jgi:DNA-binding CsgD family transcriptional regulator